MDLVGSSLARSQLVVLPEGLKHELSPLVLHEIDVSDVAITDELLLPREQRLRSGFGVIGNRCEIESGCSIPAVSFVLYSVLSWSW